MIIRLAAVFVLATAGAVEAQTAPLALDLVQARAAETSARTLDLSTLYSAVAFTDAQAEALRTGVARTSVDHHFANRLMGSAGFLCGLHPGVDDADAAAAMRGTDPQGRFLGAKLSFAFK